MNLNPELRMSQHTPDNASDELKHVQYLYEKSYGAVMLAMIRGELFPTTPLGSRWGGALSIYIPMKHIAQDSPDPSRTTIASLQYFLRNGGHVDTFTLGYDTVGFWTTNETEWLLALKCMDLFRGLGLYTALLSVRVSPTHTETT